MEQAGHARARQLRDGDELPYREIASILDAEGIQPKRGERWHPETVRRMLANTGNAPHTAKTVVGGVDNEFDDQVEVFPKEDEPESA
ncbi:recombinase family protein [Streptomyces mirabilis]|uniref:recombinase family protein n=1 Tax=Streptomyces mirabilis TaxID=68239 RepID=UPI00369D6F6A